MLFRVEAKALRSALTVLKTVTRSPRIISSDLLHTVHMQMQGTQLSLTATNLATRLTVAVPIEADYSSTYVQSSMGCVDLQELLRFAKVVKDGTIVATHTDMEPRILLHSIDKGRVGAQRATLPFYASIAFPIARDYPIREWATAVSVAELLMALEHVSIDGTNRSPSAVNEVSLTPGFPDGMQLTYADGHRIVSARVCDVTPDWSQVKGVILDGCSVQPLIIFLRTLRAARVHIAISEHTLRIYADCLDEALCLMRSLTAPVKPPLINGGRKWLFTTDAVELERAVIFASKGELTNYVTLSNDIVNELQSELVVTSTSRESSTRLPALMPVATLNVAVPAFTLLDLCRIAREEPLVAFADNWRGVLSFNVGDTSLNDNDYRITSARWGNG